MSALYIQKICKVFKAIDSNGNGMISIEEIDELLQDDRNCRLLKELGVAPSLVEQKIDFINFCQFFC